MNLSVLFIILIMFGRISLLGYERIEFNRAAKNRDPLVSTFLLFSIAGIMLLPLLFLTDFDALSGIGYASLSGTLYSLAFTLYVYVLSNYEVSLVTPLYNFNVFFLFILSVLFLGESFYWFKLVGMALLFIGTALLERKHSLKESVKAVFTNRGCLLMIVVSLLIALGRIIDGLFVKTTTDPFLYSIIQYWIISLYLLIAIVGTKKLRLIREVIAGNYKHFLLGSFANAYSYVLLLVLLSFFNFELSIAEPLSMLSLLVTLGLSVWILKEDIKGRLIGAILMIIGGILLVNSFRPLDFIP
ncbi:MAG: EamA family transporter [Candidatus Lokiarchaeota archaeon]|nr:EamA family transporter [Candidatus Lokiarchaeota archaeon]